MIQSLAPFCQPNGALAMHGRHSSSNFPTIPILTIEYQCGFIFQMRDTNSILEHFPHLQIRHTQFFRTSIFILEQSHSCSTYICCIPDPRMSETNPIFQDINIYIRTTTFTNTSRIEQYDNYCNWYGNAQFYNYTLYIKIFPELQQMESSIYSTGLAVQHDNIIFPSSFRIL